MSAHLSLYRRFILRPLLRNSTRTIVTLTGIGLGVAVMLAIRIANQSSLESFRAATYSIAGDASLQIAGSAGPFDELLLQDAAWLGKYGRVSPVVEGVCALASDAGDRRP